MSVGVTPLPVRYPAGWNLVRGLAGTLFSDVIGQLCYLPFPPTCHNLGVNGVPTAVNTPAQQRVRVAAGLRQLLRDRPGR